jgi:MFS family permease
VAASLQSQLAMLLTSDDTTSCNNTHATDLRTLLTAAYALGSGSASLLWGPIADRLGRRPVALLGLAGMAACCLSMGFATDVVTCTALRFLAGACGAATVVAALTMVGDLSESEKERAVAASRFPLIAVLGGVGQLLQGTGFGTLISEAADKNGLNVKGVWERFPTLGGQIACGTVVLLITICAAVVLQEVGQWARASIYQFQLTKLQTLSRPTNGRSSDPEDQSLLPRIQIVDSDFNSSSDSLASTGSAPAPIALPQLLKAPSLISLVSSFSILVFHSSAFSSLLPRLSHLAAGIHLNLPCSTTTVHFVVRLIASLTVLFILPRITARWGQLRPYRVSSALFPALYLLLPFLALACYAMSSDLLHGFLTFITLLSQNLLLITCSSFAYLLLLSSAPDAFSAGSVVGLLGLPRIAQAIADAGVSGAFVASEPGNTLVAGGVWVLLVGSAVVGAGLVSWVREGVRVEEDLPPEVLCWETCYEIGVTGFDSDDEDHLDV